MVRDSGAYWNANLKRIGIKANDSYPFTLENVARNVIAHEIGLFTKTC
jgi:hypothetical protein